MPPLTSIVQKRRRMLFRHLVRMDESADARRMQYIWMIFWFYYSVSMQLCYSSERCLYLTYLVVCIEPKEGESYSSIYGGRRPLHELWRHMSFTTSGT